MEQKDICTHNVLVRKKDQAGIEGEWERRIWGKYKQRYYLEGWYSQKWKKYKLCKYLIKLLYEIN